MAKPTSDRKVGSSGPLNCRAMIIGEAPGKDEEKALVPFVGKTGEELDRTYLPMAGLRRNECYVTNVYKYHPKNDATPTDEQVREGMPELMDEIARLQTDVIITLGAIAHGVFSEIPLDLQHGIPYEWCGKVIIPCYHPAAGLHQGRYMTLLLDDFKAVREYMRGGFLLERFPAMPWNFKLLSDPAEIDVLLEWSELVAIDTESGKGGRPYLIQFSTDGINGFAFHPAPELNAAFDSSLSHCRTIAMHNAKYDLRQLWKLGIHPPIEAIYDTMQAAYLLGNQPKGLKALAYRHLNVRMTEWEEMMEAADRSELLDYITRAAEIAWPKLDPVVEFKGWDAKVRQPQAIERRMKALLKKAELPARELYRLLAKFEGIELVTAQLGPVPEPTCEDVPPEVLLPYACTDAVMTWRMYHVLAPMIEQEGLQAQLDIDHGAIVYAARMEDNGILINTSQLSALSEDLQKRADKIFVDIQADMMNDYDMPADKTFNPNSSPQVRWLLNKIKEYPKSTQAKYIEPLARKHPIIAKLLAYKRLLKIKGTYADPMQHTDADGRIRTDFSLTRTETGRLASSRPNIQNIPVRSKDGKKIREAIVAPPGWSIVAIDHSQVEMRILAHESQDKTLLYVFHNGLDIHSENSMTIFGDTTPEHRKPIKNVGFGVVYRITAKGLVDQMRAMGLDDWDDEQLCQNLIDAWFAKYPGAKRCMDGYDVVIRRDGRIRDMFGRYRLIPEIKSTHRWIREAGIRQGGNAPIQSAAAGIIKINMGFRNGLLPIIDMFNSDETVIREILQVHDELVFEIRDDKLAECIPVIKAVMEQAVELTVPLLCDVEVGTCYGVIDEYKIVPEDDEQEDESNV